jgi:hypothetical protein
VALLDSKHQYADEEIGRGVLETEPTSPSLNSSLSRTRTVLTDILALGMLSVFLCVCRQAATSS